MSRFSTVSNRISRQTTNYTDALALTVASAPTIDQLATALPSIAPLDKLWTQIDVLDDVKAMAHEVDASGTFFNEDFTALLTRLKESQARLLTTVLRHQEASEQARASRRHNARQQPSQPDSNPGEHWQDQQRTKQRMAEFFLAKDQAQAEQGQARDFSELDEYVADVREGLADVADKLASFDDVTKKLW